MVKALCSNILLFGRLVAKIISCAIYNAGYISYMKFRDRINMDPSKIQGMLSRYADGNRNPSRGCNCRC